MKSVSSTKLVRTSAVMPRGIRDLTNDKNRIPFFLLLVFVKTRAWMALSFVLFLFLFFLVAVKLMPEWLYPLSKVPKAFILFWCFDNLTMSFLDDFLTLIRFVGSWPV